MKHHPAVGNPDVTGEAWYIKKYAEYDTPAERRILATHYPIIHAFLALALAHHTGVHNDAPGWAVEKIMSALYAENKDYNAMKREYKDIARAIAYQAKKHGLTADEEKTREVMEQALLKTFKIVDKLLPEVTEERLKIVGRALHKETDDPFVVLRNAGIDIEPELEEFRQFLAEISGKKIEPQKSTAPFVKGVDTFTALSQAKLELLSIIRGLEFAGFSEEARKRAAEVLRKMRELASGEPNEERLLELGLYAYALEAIKEGDRKRLERLKGV
ncbi:MAG: hypothetical protein J7L37_05730 [Thermococcus sp.]|nr:hypothetical protein [Thermococcus sp.]